MYALTYGFEYIMRYIVRVIFSIIKRGVAEFYYRKNDEYNILIMYEKPYVNVYIARAKTRDPLSNNLCCKRAQGRRERIM